MLTTANKVCLVIVLVMTAIFIWLIANDPADAQETTTPEPKPTVVKTKRLVPPDRVERKSRFTPDAQPSPSRVIEIARLEQVRWGGPSIIGRMQCESTLRWNATNGQYRGLLQIGPIWGYLYGGAPRTVRLVDKDTIKRPVRVVTFYSDGSREEKVIGKKKVKRVTIKKGKLPAGADPYHGWAAIRVGQLAVSGGRTTSWSCGL